MHQSTKPNITSEKVKVGDETRDVETWHLGQGTIVQNSVGCKHYFIQVTADRVRCTQDMCGLQLFGHCEKGILLDKREK